MKTKFLIGCVVACVLALGSFAELETKEKGDLRDTDKVVVGGYPDQLLYLTTEVGGATGGTSVYRLVAHNEKITAGAFAGRLYHNGYIVCIDNDSPSGRERGWFLRTLRSTASGWYGYKLNLVREWSTKAMRWETKVHWSPRWFMNDSGSVQNIGYSARGWTEEGSVKFGELIRLLDGDGGDADWEEYYFYAAEIHTVGIAPKTQAQTDANIDARIDTRVTKQFVENLGIEAGGGVDEEAVNALIEANLAPEKFKQAAGAALNTIYDETLRVTWKAVMLNGSLYYTAVTNANISAIN